MLYFVPCPQGTHADYDAAAVHLSSFSGELEGALREVRQRLGGGREIAYVTINNNTIIEVRRPTRSCAFKTR